MRRLMIIIPKHLHSELLALRQIIPAEQVHSLRIRKSGVKGCESAFGDYKAGLGPADLEFVDCGCGRHSFGGRVWCGWFVCNFAGWQSGLKSLDFEDGSSSGKLHEFVKKKKKKEKGGAGENMYGEGGVGCLTQNR